MSAAQKPDGPLKVDNLADMAPTAFEDFKELTDSAKMAAAMNLEALNLPVLNGNTLRFNKDGSMFVVESYPAPRQRRYADSSQQQQEDWQKEEEESMRYRRYLRERWRNAAYDVIDGAQDWTGGADGVGFGADGVGYVDDGRRSRRYISQASSSLQVQQCEVPVLHSRRGARNRIVLDFDGHTARAIDSTWGAFAAKAYDVAGNGPCFNAAEQKHVTQVWARVAEDYAPFDVDVTTEPLDQTSTTIHVVITSARQENGKPMPYSDSGGVAVIGVFGSPSIAYYSPALVYWDNLNFGSESHVADAISHEAGHNFGLGHDGFGNNEYYDGMDGTTAMNSWGPIMGAPYGRALTQWSRGNYAGATNSQDDIDIITRQTGLAMDEAGDGPGTAASVVYTDSNAFFADGVISSHVDKDWWVVQLTDTGSIEATVIPWFASEGSAGNNVDLKLTMYASDGRSMVVRSNPSGDTSASISRTALPAGVYFLEVDGVGDVAVFNSDYGSIGQYRLTGSVSTGPPPSTRAPPTLTRVGPDPPPRSREPCAPDKYEDNDVHEQAYDLTSELTSPQPGGVRGTICARDLDWYRVPVAAHSTIMIIMYIDVMRGDLDLLFFTPDGMLVDESATVTRQEGVQYTDQTGHDSLCYVLVRGVADSQGNYSLHVYDSSMNGFCAYDRFELNDAPSSAYDLAPPVNTFSAWLCSDDQDWFRIPVCAGSDISVDVSFSSTDGNIDVVLYDPDGRVADRSTGTGGVERVFHSNHGPEAHYLLHVYERNGDSATYTVHITRQCDYPSSTISTIIPLHTTMDTPLDTSAAHMAAPAFLTRMFGSVNHGGTYGARALELITAFAAYVVVRWLV
ncbi:hypothetical protein PTSG_09711 [Salpingoeca rosetta]|uniref:Peptidase C-terminal archaeal/bacterial domain-containing protein n=1 Tax=Salpingoeca rosetta (strain ATCC 50818 / BSB-021) TaxID=946362 RepID=F2UNU0_SALR5|nr:uncharacterized protein PTSG_09711 [Salpingoeca rosetta]EGD79295.1 hypothetical protein PTSG_09711 [Salpingoeca rosetta]|eukprot:XP_004989066.1 hypothetical protein PTSG_09711 [Salpingoeca rosetta]